MSIGSQISSRLTGMSIEYLRRTVSTAPYLLWIYLFFYGSLFLDYRAVTSDEVINFEISREFNFFQTNVPPANTGAIFWMFLGFFPNIASARIFFFALFAISVYLIIEVGKTAKKESLFLLLLWMSMPFAFWTGKLLSPEIPLLFLTSLSLTLFPTKKKFSFVIIGIAVGIKLSAVPVLVFFLLTELKRREILKCFGYLSVALTTFALTNIFNLKRFLQSLLTNPENRSTAGSMTRLGEILVGKGQSWDSVQLGSFGHFFIHPALVFTLLIIGMTMRVKNTLSLLLTLLTSTLLIWNSRDGFGWYWLPIVPLIIRYFSDVYKQLHQQNYLKKFLTVALVLIPIANSIYNIGSTQNAIGEKIQHIRTLNEADQRCLIEFLKDETDTNVFSIGDFGLEIPKIKTLKHKVIEGQFEVIKKDMPSGFIIISNRLMRNEYFLKPILESKRQVIVMEQCESVFILQVR